MALSKKSKQIYAKIEALENAASMIASHEESGDVIDEELGEEYTKSCMNLARQLNNRANKIRKKYGLEENTYKY